MTKEVRPVTLFLRPEMGASVAVVAQTFLSAHKLTNLPCGVRNFFLGKGHFFLDTRGGVCIMVSECDGMMFRAKVLSGGGLASKGVAGPAKNCKEERVWIGESSSRRLVWLGAWAQQAR